MKKIILSLFTVLVIGSAAGAATVAYFQDTETSTGNTFTAGSIDLTVDNNNGVNTVKFNVPNMKYLDTIYPSYTIKNIGTLPGYLDLENISFSGNENGCLEPETEAGDSTCGTPGAGEGEMGEVIGMTMRLDDECNGADMSDLLIVGPFTIVKNVLSSYQINQLIPAGGQVCLATEFMYTGPSAMHSKTMGDDLVFNITFELGETTSQ